MYKRRQTGAPNRRFQRSWLLALVALVLAGVAYRLAADRLKLVSETAVNLPVPLSRFPLEIGPWKGRDIPLSEAVQKVTGNDDYLNRLYENSRTNQWANVYIAYSGRPRNMLGHRPQVCYPAGGWVHDTTERTEIFSNSARAVPCLLHQFHKPAPAGQQTFVLNFYILNGRITNDESGFSGVGWRTPNIAGDPARYVAQVQVSSALENAVHAAARDFTDLILKYLPDENGNVAVSQTGPSESRSKDSPLSGR